MLGHVSCCIICRASSRVKSVAFSPDGNYIVSGGFDNQNNLMVWDVKQVSGSIIYRGIKVGVSSVAFSPDGNYIVSGGEVIRII